MLDQIPYVDQVWCWLVKNCDLYRVTDKQTNKQTNKQTDERAIEDCVLAKISENDDKSHDDNDMNVND